MKIVSIYSGYIYSVQYEGVDENEFDRLFNLWNNVDYVIQFIDDNLDFLKTKFWQKIPEPESIAYQIFKEAEELENLFYTLNENTQNGEKPDFDCHFKYLDGKYKYVLQWVPMKSYCTEYPSLLRLYAIKMSENVYLITGGGIKLADTIQNSPDLKNHVLQNIEKVRAFLQGNGIIDGNDLNQE